MLLAFIPVGLQPYAKYIAPAFMAVLGLVLYALIEGELDRLQFEVGLVGLVSASLTFVVTNYATGIGKYLKALVPTLLTVVGVVIHYLVTNEWNNTEWVAGATGLVTAFIALIVPNAVTADGWHH